MPYEPCLPKYQHINGSVKTWKEPSSVPNKETRMSTYHVKIASFFRHTRFLFVHMKCRDQNRPKNCKMCSEHMEIIFYFGPPNHFQKKSFIGHIWTQVAGSVLGPKRRNTRLTFDGPFELGANTGSAFLVYFVIFGENICWHTITEHKCSI